MESGYQCTLNVGTSEPGIRDWVLFDHWIRDPGSGIGFFRIPDLGSRIPRPYPFPTSVADSGCLSRISDPDFYPTFQQSRAGEQAKAAEQAHNRDKPQSSTPAAATGAIFLFGWGGEVESSGY